MTLYQKYRSRTFSEIVGQEFAKRALPYALLNNKLVSSYLFCGPRGTGKTSTARILAKSIQCLHLSENGNPCLTCSHCIGHQEGSFIDTVELDAASNNSVDDIRSIIDHAEFMPSVGKYKVYIIDEVHMLSGSAFNAFLKILEEPPAHVKFLLATTEPHKLPETIISRVQRFEFRKFSRQEIIDHLTFIASQEGITTNQEGLELIARLSDGGMRDAISIFEQYSIMGSLDTEAIHQGFGTVKGSVLNELTNTYIKRNIVEYQSLVTKNVVNSKRLIEDWIEYCSKILRSNPNKTVTNEVINLAADLIRANLRLKQIPFSQLPLELLIQERCFGKNDGTIVPVAPSGNSIGTSNSQQIPQKIEPTEQQETIKNMNEKNIEPIKNPPVSTEILSNEEKRAPVRDFSVMEFIRFIDNYESVHPTLKAIMKKTTFTFHDKKLAISHANKLEYNKLEEPRNNALLKQILDEFMGVSTELEIIFLSKGKINPNIANDIF
ncbi:MAG: DNA polymerase III subunit gamma/tau [Candidatus Gracilibacteria bacterium]